jgi:hypothetical protein
MNASALLNEIYYQCVEKKENEKKTTATRRHRQATLIKF